MSHTCKNLIPMVVTRAMANSSKNHALLICFHHWTSEKIPFLYFFLHKSWIWQTLGHVTKNISWRHFHNASKECFWPKIFLNFMHGFKSAILAKMKNCQNGTFEPVHEIQNFFWPKAFFWSIMKMAIRNFFRNMSQGLPNPGFMQEKVQKGDRRGHWKAGPPFLPLPPELGRGMGRAFD